jgi:uncharacterized protein
MLEQRVEQDLREALLLGDSEKVAVLRGLKNTFFYSKLAAGKKDQALSNEESMALLFKEAKKRQESADIYIKAGDQTRAETELSEKFVIEEYLPKALTEEEVSTLVDEVFKEMLDAGPQAMGYLIKTVKDKANGSIDGAIVAKLVKKKLTR